MFSSFGTAYSFTRCCFWICLICHIQYFALLSGTRLSKFNITVGPYNGQYGKCGSSSNYMDTGETASFTCDPNAKGTSLKITIKDRKELLTLCEVLVFGKGMTCSNFNQPRSNNHFRFIAFLLFFPWLTCRQGWRWPWFIFPSFLFSFYPSLLCSYIVFSQQSLLLLMLKCFA